jgi:tetratricopeptide (TPR) repeat protein
MIADSVIVKDRVIYRASITPVDVVEFESDCDYTVGDTSMFRADPSAHFEIFFASRTLADYRWNSIRDYVEHEHRLLDTLCNFDDRQRINLFLAPCESPTTHLDPATGCMIDPSKGNVVAIYSDERMSDMAAAFKLMEFFRNWGYSPRMIAEGIAGFSDFNHFYVKEYAQSNPIPDPAGYFVSDSFTHRGNWMIARRTAGSFCQYLKDRYGLARFEQLYRQASDLNLSETLAGVYGRAADEIISDWRLYIDTLTIDPKLYRYHSQRLGTQRDYEGSLALLKKREVILGEADDRDLSDMGDLSYLLGRYGEAQRYYGMRLAENDSSAIDIVVYGNMAGLNGDFDTADSAYLAVLQLDSLNAIAQFKIGQIMQFKADDEAALNWYHLAALSTRPEEDPIVVDAHMSIGEILQSRGEPDSAYIYFVSAINGARRSMSGMEPNAMSLVRAGEGLVRIGEWESAMENLNLALLIEERPYYVGRAALAMGQACDLKGDRASARRYYEMTKKAPAGFIYSAMADRYISEPYSIDR